MNSGFPANIVKSHGRNYQRLMLVIWPDEWGASEIKNWLFDIAPNLTFSKEQQEQSDNKNERPNEVICSLALSAAGYKKAELPTEMLDHNTDEGTSYFDKSLRTDEHIKKFWAYGNGLGEPGASIELTTNDLIHCCVLLACQDTKAIETFTGDLLSIGRGDEIKKLWFEDGVRNRQPGDSEAEFGPLGFRDGITNPRSKVYDITHRKDFSHNGSEGYGSYMVYQKIKVEKSEFDKIVNDLSTNSTYGYVYSAHSGTSRYSKQEFIQASLMGRFKDGTPITAPHGDYKEVIDYTSTDAANFCPAFAHTRAANARTAKSINAKAPFVRRGVIFYDGASAAQREDVPNKDTTFGATNKYPDGLHFISYQSSISKLVKVMDDMKAAGDIIAYRGEANVAGKCPVKWGVDPNKQMLSGLVTKLLNVEAFFVPSRKYLLHYLGDWRVEDPEPTKRQQELA